MAEADYRSRDIHVLRAEDFEDEEEKALREYREKMAALLPVVEQGTNFTGMFAGQAELDAGFDAFMDEEYDDGKLGELYEEDVGATDKIDKKQIDEACDEFI